MTVDKKTKGLEIAVVGLSGRFPGGSDHRAFWRNLVQGRDLVTVFSEEELIRRGVPEDVVRQEQYVRSEAVLEDKGFFDPRFFGYSPEEAMLMDPQIRLFHQQCWQALEDAGYAGKTDKYNIGLFAGAAVNDHWKIHVYGQAPAVSVDPFYFDMITSTRFMCTLVSYKLDLRGPSLFIDTACSTSLSAVHLACRSLLTRECGVAMAGGVKISTARQKGYLYQEGMINSRDGYCRSFDAKASGIISGEGVGVVVLRRLQDAVRDGDHIYAVIRASALNNDGHHKVGYTAPGVKGQVECITMAHRLAGVEPADISYIEAHGTATPLGDPIEVRALNEAFGAGVPKKSCAIGSVKSNMGHLDAAAGVAGLIKTVLSLQHKTLPSSLHFDKPNPDIDFDGGPLFVNSSTRPWTHPGGGPLMAGVSSFGIGGTNVHVVLEEAPESAVSGAGSQHKLLSLSAETEGSLQQYIPTLRNFLTAHPDINPDDMAYTFHTGRKAMRYRKTFVFGDLAALTDLLDDEQGASPIVRAADKGLGVGFMFSGAGSQYPQMGKDLYLHNAFFREEIDRGFDLLRQMTGRDYHEIFYPTTSADRQINKMLHTQPAIFIFGYALARMLMRYGLTPDYMIGHSIGEYPAACIAGVFSFEDGLRLVVRRGELMDGLPQGAMVSAAVHPALAAGYLTNEISIAAVNGPGQVVFSGEEKAINALIERLERQDISCIRLQVDHAGHSPMTDGILDAYRQDLQRAALHPAKIPFVSNLTGTFITAEQCTSVDYWLQHMRHTVQFSDGLQTLLAKPGSKLLIEVGAGHSLTNLLRQQPGSREKAQSVNIVRHPKENKDDGRQLAEAVARCWALGAALDWTQYYRGQQRKKISLPTYQFEQVLFPVEVDPLSHMTTDGWIMPTADETMPYEVQKVGRPGWQTAFEDAATPTEQKVREIFEHFFGIDGIGVNDDFFEMGGDSLKGMMLLKKIKKEFNVNLHLKDFFTQANIRVIAARVDEIQWLTKEVRTDNEIII